MPSVSQGVSAGRDAKLDRTVTSRPQGCCGLTGKIREKWSQPKDREGGRKRKRDKKRLNSGSLETVEAIFRGGGYQAAPKTSL